MPSFVSRKLVQAAAVLGGIVLLAGCSGGDSGSTASSAASAASSAVSSAAPAASSAASAASSAQDAASDITDQAWREALERVENSIPATASCTIAESDANVGIDGDCESLSVTGSDSTIVAEGVTNLTVAGSGNTVFVKDPASMSVLGSDNTIVWSGDQEPSVQQTGADNTIRQAA